MKKKLALRRVTIGELAPPRLSGVGGGIGTGRCAPGGNTIGCSLACGGGTLSGPSIDPVHNDTAASEHDAE